MGLFSEDFDKEVDWFVEHNYFLEKYFNTTTLSVLVTTPRLEIRNQSLPDGIPTKYIDLAETTQGRYALFCKHLAQFRYDETGRGLLIDNIDQIPDNADRENWEDFVRYALKRENEVPIPGPNGDYCIDFGRMHIAARCSEKPAYLDGQSMQAYIISDDPIL